MVTGNVSGADLVKTGTSSLDLNANNTFTGNLNCNSGTMTLSNASTHAGPTTVGVGTTLTLNGAGTALNTSSINVNGGTMLLDDSASNFNLGNRLSTTAPLTFIGGNLNVTGNQLASTLTGTTETVGPIVLAGGNTTDPDHRSNVSRARPCR